MYTISETAKQLGVSAPTLRRWEKTGKLPALRTLGGHRRYPEQYIRCAVEGRTPEPIDPQLQNSAPTLSTLGYLPINRAQTAIWSAKSSELKNTLDYPIQHQYLRSTGPD